MTLDEVIDRVLEPSTLVPEREQAAVTVAPRRRTFHQADSLNDAIDRVLASSYEPGPPPTPAVAPTPPSSPPPPEPGFFDRLLEPMKTWPPVQPHEFTPLQQEVPEQGGPPPPDRRKELLQLLENWTIGPFVEAGKLLRGPSRFEPPAHTLTPDQEALRREAGPPKSPYEMTNEELEEVVSKLLPSAMIGAGGHIAGGPRFGGSPTPRPAFMGGKGYTPSQPTTTKTPPPPPPGTRPPSEFDISPAPPIPPPPTPKPTFQGKTYADRQANASQVLDIPQSELKAQVRKLMTSKEAETGDEALAIIAARVKPPAPPQATISESRPVTPPAGEVPAVPPPAAQTPVSAVTPKVVPAPQPRFEMSEEIAALKTSAPLVNPKNRTRVIDTGTKRMKKLEGIMNREIPDFVGQQKITLKDEANRPYLNVLAQLETDGNAKLGVFKDAGTTSLGPWSISKDVRGKHGLSDTASLPEQAAVVEKLVSQFRKQYGDDMAAVTTAYWRPESAKHVFGAGTPKAKAPVIAGGGPTGAQVIAEAERTAGYSQLIEPRLQSRIHKEITEAITDYFVQEKIPFDPAKGRINVQFAEFLETDKVNFERLDRVLQMKGLTRQALKEAYKEGASAAGSDLQPLSVAIRKLEQLDGTAPPDPTRTNTLNLLKRLDNIRRGQQTGQIATLVRNIESQGWRVMEESMSEAVNTIMAKVMKPDSAAAQRGIGEAALGPIRHLGSPRKSYVLAQKIIKPFPKEEAKLFGTYQSDLPTVPEAGPVTGAADRALRVAEKVSSTILTPQRAQEFTFRSAAFLDYVQQGLKDPASYPKRFSPVKKQMLMTTPLEQLNPATIPKNIIEKAVQHASEMTFAADPKTKLGQFFVGAVKELPFIGTGPVPYPRFIANGIQHQIDFGPAGFLKLVGPGEKAQLQRAKLSAGDYRTISKAVVGTAELYAAWEFVNSKYAGEHWYHIKPYPDDPDPEKRAKRWDMRAFGPLVTPVFVASVIKKATKGELTELSTKDIVSGVLGGTIRAGVGLYVVDKALDELRAVSGQSGASSSKWRIVKEYLGEMTSGYLTPWNTVKDVVSAYDAEQAKLRFKREEPFMGPIKDTLPGVSKGLPELESPTQTATPTREAPLKRQLLGISETSYNAVQQELAKHGFDYREILPSQGHPEADQAMAKFMGPIVEHGIGALVQTPGYQAMTYSQQSAILTEALKRVRAMSSTPSKKTLRPEVVLELYLKTLPKHIRRLIVESPTYQQLLKAIGD